MRAVRKGFLHMFSANMLNQLLGFGSLLVVTKALQPSEVGALKIIQSYVAVCLTISTFGFPSAIIKFCSEIKEIGLREYVLKRSIVLSAFISCIVCAGVMFLSANELISDDLLVARWLPYYILIIVPNTAYTILLTYMQAIKDFKKMAGMQSFLKILSVFVIIVATYSLGMGGYVGAVVSMMIISLVILIKQIGSSFLLRLARPIPSGFNSFVFMSAFASVLETLCIYLDIFFLDYFISDRDLVGYYAMSSMFMLIGSQFIGTVQSFLTPYFAEKSYDYEWLWREMLQCQKYLSFAMFAFSFVVYWGVDLLINFYYGIQYSSVLIFLRIMLMQFWLHSTCVIFGCALLSINKVQYNVFTITVFIIAKAILSYYFITVYGVLGFSYAQVLAEVPFVIMVYIVTRIAFSKKKLM